MKVVIDNKIPFIHGVLERYANVVYLEGSKISRADLLDADALIIRTRTKCNSNLLEGTNVRFIATATIGFDHIATAYCDAHQIAWTNAEGCNSSSVQQYMASALFHLAEKFGFSLQGKSIGIVGVGNVGEKVEKLCKTFGMNVLRNDPPRARAEGDAGFVSLDRIIAESDIITLHVPLHKEGVDRTVHMVDETFLSRLRPEQILINASRGAVVDGGALKTALKARRLVGCILDVWENEPGIDLELLQLVDIGTPHIAGYSADGKANGTAMSVQAFAKFFNIDLRHWYPPHVPSPPTPVLELDGTGLNSEKILATLIQKTYDITWDDRRLRNSPATFEEQRGKYPLRREFPAYTVNAVHVPEMDAAAIRTLGFQLQ